MNNKEKLEKSLTLILWTFALAACMSQRSSKETPTVPVVETPKPTSGVIYDATKQASSTEVIINTPTAEVKPTATQVSIEGEGGPFTLEQVAIIESKTVQDKIAELDKWVEWWGSTTNRPFLPEKVGYDVVFDAANMPTGKDDPSLAGKVGVLITWQTDDGKMVRAERPVDTINGGHQQVPPSGGTIGEGFGPLILTAGENQNLIFRNGQWVRTNKETGGVEERIAITPPYSWEKATLDLNPDNMTQVMDWDRKPMTAEASAKLMQRSDQELIALAPTVDPKAFYPDKPEMTALTAAGVTRLPDGTTLVGYVSNETKTVGSKTMNLPGGYWNVGEGRFTKELGLIVTEPLVEKFGVVPTHEYRIVGNQFIDMHNLAVMAKLENGGWRDTAVWEKYGHLVPVDERMTYYNESSVIFDFNQRSLYSYIEMGVRYTGNVKTSKYFEEHLQNEMNLVETQVVFRDNTGELRLIEAKIPSDPKATSIMVSIETGVSTYSVNGGGSLLKRTLDELVDYLDNPGDRGLLNFAYRRPDIPEREQDHPSGGSTRAYIASFYLQEEVKEELVALAETIKLEGEVVVPKELAVPVFFISPLIETCEVYRLFDKECPIKK